jgi:hypothetical protein
MKGCGFFTIFAPEFLKILDPHYIQFGAMDCGPACLRMIAKYYGKSHTLQTLRQRSFITREGVSMLGISNAAETVGLHTNGIWITFKQSGGCVVWSEFNPKPDSTAHDLSLFEFFLRFNTKYTCFFSINNCKIKNYDFCIFNIDSQKSQSNIEIG